MSDAIPRLRMFAGPNGSGKTTVKNSLGKSESWFGLYINPDDVEAVIRQTGLLPLEPLRMPVTVEAVRAYFASSAFLAKAGFADAAHSIQLTGNSLDFRGLAFNSYHASVLSDFLRRRALEKGLTFSFETVMSAEDKVELLRDAQSRGYRTYLYFVATDNPDVNIQRVRTRVAAGGHDVPEDKIVARYHRSLELLKQAIPFTDRAFFFDTSDESAWYFAEIIDGDRVELQSDEIPSWFQPIWDSNPET
ncbi:zeta toxin family protein [soil metagenome]